jgi:hypothetical protein
MSGDERAEVSCSPDGESRVGGHAGAAVVLAATRVGDVLQSISSPPSFICSVAELKLT